MKKLANKWRRLLQYIKWVYIWKWNERYHCHGNLWPCQYLDNPNDNPSGWWEN